ncbi:DNA-3-methyladenine glycosylase [Niallia taxi]|uniref:DNA-3-methyladenine glycosylase family protein n=1 Tax=Niallia taxi TaxID=2499688 RepID=UPI0021A95079|nr:DNA-3-methyladenine glycosylase [Niallia taxi]MCT2343769.1 DNA-3-methyladenine glycosylase [Niallia taxi]WOD62780.1 DNA-3-methyladenine glycosylase [Niallia taxi]
MRIVPVLGPYNFDLVLSRLALDPLHQVDATERSVKVPIGLENEKIVAKVKAIGTTEGPVFQLEGIPIKHEEEVIRELTRIFQWESSLIDVHEHFQGTELKELFNSHFGTPLVLDFHPYNCLVKCIIHQQLNIKFAYTLTERFVKAYGTEVNGAWFYPSPDRVAALTVEELRELQFSTRKAEYIIDISKEIAEGRLSLESLYDRTDEEIMKELIVYRGIGQWTIQNVLLFGLGRQNLFPIADIGIQNALKKLLGLEAKPTKEEMEQLIPAWEPYLSYASLYLWRSIE